MYKYYAMNLDFPGEVKMFRTKRERDAWVNEKPNGLYSAEDLKDRTAITTEKALDETYGYLHDRRFQFRDLDTILSCANPHVRFVVERS